MIGEELTTTMPRQFRTMHLLVCELLNAGRMVRQIGRVSLHRKDVARAFIDTITEDDEFDVDEENGTQKKWCAPFFFHFNSVPSSNFPIVVTDLLW